MLQIRDLRITKFIAHIVDHETGDFVLSDLETPIDDGGDFPSSFFEDYLRAALADENRRLACFKDPRSGRVVTAFDAWRGGLASFVDASREIALHLYDVMTSSRYAERIKRGDVMVTLFQERKEGAADSGRDSPTYMAILKITPSDAILRHVETVEGKRRVVFQRDERIPAPTEKKEIQKIALLCDRRRPDPEPFDLAILDHNIRRKNVANFFYDDFLGTTLNRDAEDDTGFILQVAKAVVANRDLGLTAPQQKTVVGQVEDVLGHREEVSPNALAEEVSLEIPDESLARVQEALVHRFETHPQESRRIQPMQVVRTSPEFARNASASRTYSLDRNVKISGPGDALDQMMDIQGPDSQGNYVISLKTRRFQIR